MMPERAALGAVLALGLAAIPLGGCADESEHVEPFAHHAPSGEGGETAKLSGLLVQNEAGCVVVRREDGADVVPVLPRPVEWDDEKSVTTLGGETDFAINPEVTLRGGEASRLPARAYLPARCDSSLGLFLVSQGR